VEDLAQRQRGDLVVYSGFNPFSSAGIDLEGWSFVIDLRKGADLNVHLNALTEAIAAHEAPDDIKARLTSEANDVAVELNNPAPDKAALLPRLVGIAILAGAASAVATAATNLLVALT
jgi:hypothetical protein